MLESKLQFDARKTGKKLKLTKLGRETEFKLKDNEIQHQFNIKLVQELEKIDFLASKSPVSRVKKSINKLVKEI